MRDAGHRPQAVLRAHNFPGRKGDREAPGRRSGRGADAAFGNEARPAARLIHPPVSYPPFVSSSRYDQPAITSHQERIMPASPPAPPRATRRSSRSARRRASTSGTDDRKTQVGRSSTPTVPRSSASDRWGRPALPAGRPLTFSKGLPDGCWLSFDEHDDGRLARPPLESLRHEGARRGPPVSCSPSSSRSSRSCASRTTASCRAAAAFGPRPAWVAVLGSMAGAMTQQGMPGQLAGPSRSPGVMQARQQPASSTRLARVLRRGIGGGPA